MDEAIIQLVKDFEKPSYKFQTDVDLREFVAGETHSPVPTGSENSALLLALRWSFKLDRGNIYFHVTITQDVT